MNAATPWFQAMEERAEAEAAVYRNWWPEVGPDVEMIEDEYVTVSGSFRHVQVWSDGIHRTKLHWPDNLLA